MIRYTNIPLPQTVVHYCQEFQIQDIVISAGSRNAPLTNGFVENPYFTTYSIVDERAAAFFALGIAQQKQRPVALVCTSGSALLNYYPAIAEAYYSDHPLVVLSADRMPHRIDIGDGQTIQQQGVFGPHLEAAATLTPDVSHATKTLLENPSQQLLPPKATSKQVAEKQAQIQIQNEEEICRVLSIAIRKMGPVHLNIPMEEPLYGLTETHLRFKAKAVAVQPAMDDIDDTYRTAWIKAQRKMILVGTQAPTPEVQALLQDLAKDPSIIVLTEVNGNIALKGHIYAIDTLMAPLELEQESFYESLRPEILLTLGGMIVSKKIKAFLRKYPPHTHWHVDAKKAYNTFYCLSAHLQMPAGAFLRPLCTIPKSNSSNYQQLVVDRYNTYIERGQRFLKGIPFSDLKVFKCLSHILEGPLQVHFANSSAIRYAQLFPLNHQVEVYCNRGTSGIDGSTATAIGAAVAQQLPTVLVTGDLSFFYDINGLWNNYIPKNFKIILINNAGGGIFRILPGEKDTPKYNTYFETVHQRNAKYVAKAFGFRYYKLQTWRSLEGQLKNFLNTSSGPAILEVKTPRTQNDILLKKYFSQMAIEPKNNG